jgi:hypothetical protein
MKLENYPYASWCEETKLFLYPVSSSYSPICWLVYKIDSNIAIGCETYEREEAEKLLTYELGDALILKTVDGKEVSVWYRLEDRPNPAEWLALLKEQLEQAL